MLSPLPLFVPVTSCVDSCITNDNSAKGAIWCFWYREIAARRSDIKTMKQTIAFVPTVEYNEMRRGLDMEYLMAVEMSEKRLIPADAEKPAGAGCKRKKSAE